MSCLGLTRDRIQEWFKRLKTYFQTDHVQVEIVRQILKQVLISIDQAYGVEPVPMDKIREQLDKYIDRKVDEKITELLEFCRLAAEAKVNRTVESSDQASSGPSAIFQSSGDSASVPSTGHSACVQSADETLSFQDCYSYTEEIPLDDVSVEVKQADNVEAEASKTKKKSLVTRLLKKRSKRSDGDPGRTEKKKKKPLLFRKLFKRLPVV